MHTEELLIAALRLPRTERAKVVQELLSSLEEPAEEVAIAWASELEKRSRQLSEGRVEPLAWETVSAEIRADLAQRRASRISP